MTSTESWTGILKNYLKADNLTNRVETFACVDVVVDGESMELELQRNEEQFTFTLNVTNKVFLKNSGITAPKDVIGKKVTLEKVKAMNPSIKKEVDSLRIIKVD